MRRAWIILEGDAAKFGGYEVRVEESAKPDEIFLCFAESRLPLTRAQWKELCGLEYHVRFAEPPKPKLLEEILCPICDAVEEPGGHGEELCL